MRPHRLWIGFGFAFALQLAAPAAHADELDPSMRALLEQSQREKRGVTVYVPGHAIPIVVTAIGSEVVEGRSQEHQRVVIDADEILAVAQP